MLEPTSMDQLLVKALDGEAMSEGELRDFGAAVIESADFAENYALTRRILRDAAELPRAEPSPEFAQRVMREVGRSPAFAAVPREGRIWAAAALALVVLLAGAGALGLSGWDWAIRERLAGAGDWLLSGGGFGAAWDGARDWAAGGHQLSAKITALARPPMRPMAWLGVLLTLLAVGLNFWPVHPPSQGGSSRKMV